MSKEQHIGSAEFWRHFEHLKQRDERGDPEAAAQAADMLVQLSAHYLQISERIRSISSAPAGHSKSVAAPRWPKLTWGGKSVY